MSETTTIERPQVSDPDLEQGDPREAHIVRKGGVTEAYVLGTPLEALCGKVFVPSRDPKSLPVCEMCKEIARGGGLDPEGLS